MTSSVPAQTEKTWTADGVTTSFPFPVRVDEASDLAVFFVVEGVEALVGGYSLEQLGQPGGVNIKFWTAPTASTLVRARRDTQPKQTVSYSDLGKVPGPTTEKQLDRLAMAAQDNRGRFAALASIVSDAMKAADDAEYAKQVALAAAAASQDRAGALEFDTLSEAQAYKPSVDPLTVRTRFRDFAFLPNSGALWIKRASQPSHPAKFQNANGTWYEMSETTVRLEMLGGLPGGNCIAAMNAALAMGAKRILVPKGAILGHHEINAEYVRIEGNDDVVFDNSVNAAGFRPGACGTVEIVGFRDPSLKVHPDVGGDIDNAAAFVLLLGGADIENLIITDNTGVTGGRIGIGANFENGRILRGRCVIARNTCKGQNGSEGGEGYGFIYSNENLTGTAVIVDNEAQYSGRHSFYISRNPGAPIEFSGNVARDHREYSTTKGINVRPAMFIVRSANVVGHGNTIDGFYDGALMISEETEGVGSPISANNVQLFGTTIRRPKNVTPALWCGYDTPSPTAKIRGALLDGISFYSTLSGAEFFNWSWGVGVTIKNVDLIYENIASGTTRMFVLQGNALANSEDLLIERVRIHLLNCGGTFAILRPVVPFATSEMRAFLKDIALAENTLGAAVLDWQPSVTMTNNQIEIEGFAYAPGGKPKKSTSPNTVTVATVTDAWTPGSVPAGGRLQKNITVPGAALRDFAVASFSDDLGAAGITAAVAAVNVVTVTIFNNSGAPVILGAGIVSVLLIKG